MNRRRWTDYFSDKGSKRYPEEKTGIAGPFFAFFLLFILMMAIVSAAAFFLVAWLQAVAFGDISNELFWKRLGYAFTHLSEPAAQQYLKDTFEQVLRFFPFTRSAK